MPSIKIQGMHCENCRQAVLEALSALPGLTDVKVDLAGGSASWQDLDPASPVDPDKIRETVRNLGFDA